MLETLAGQLEHARRLLADQPLTPLPPQANLFTISQAAAAVEAGDRLDDLDLVRAGYVHLLDAYNRGVRACLDWLKAKERRQIPFSVLAPERNPEQFIPSRPETDGFALDRAEELQQLMAAVEALPDDYREVVMLYYYEDVTYRDLAETLGVSSATINARLTKARALLRERLGDHLRR